MKLYLSSIRIPTPDDLSNLLGKPLASTSIALIPNAQDYYSERARGFKVGDMVDYLKALGCTVDVVDLRECTNAESVQQKLDGHDLIWAMGGNTYILRYEMQRSGFDKIIGELLEKGVVYGGDSAGALVAGLSLAGIESADDPRFAETMIEDGMSLVPFVVLPHVDNPEFTEAVGVVEALHKDRKEIIKLKDSQAVVFDGDEHKTVEASVNIK